LACAISSLQTTTKLFPALRLASFLPLLFKPEAMYVLQQIKVLTVGVGSRIELLTS